MSKPAHHDTPLCLVGNNGAIPCGSPVSTICPQRGRAAYPHAYCVASGHDVKLSPADWYRTFAADESWDRTRDRVEAKPRATRPRQVQLVLFDMARAAVPHMPSMRRLAAFRVPLGTATAIATCVSLGARMRIHPPHDRMPLCVWLEPLTRAARPIAEGAGLEVTTVLGKVAGVWVTT